MINKDLGYYVCNGIEFSSKVDALIYSTTVDKPVEWIFHNVLFENYNWLVEPEESLDYFYDKRARELREQYDYLVLSYSGGSDTNNILEAFIRQGLHIDEIVTNHISNATKKTTVLDASVKKSWNFAAEHELQVVPRLKYISEKLPRTKITVLDVSDIVLSSMKMFDDVNWVLKRNDHLSIGQLFRYNYFHFSNMKKQFDKNLKVAIVVGLEKPKTVIANKNKFYLSFNDTVANITTINDFNDDYDNVKVEMFYWSKDTIPMMCKQGHVIKRYLEDNPKVIPYWRLEHTFNGIKLNANDLNRLIHEKVLRRIIYTTWDESWFQTDKSTSWWNTEFDAWFRNDATLKKEYDMWKRGIQYLETTIPDYIEYKNGSADRMQIFKHSYFLGIVKGMKND
jgi:hypothetical protein